MFLIRLIYKNLLRHPFRNLLTAFGVAVALISFTMIQTMLSAWNSGVQHSSKTRMITRNAISLVVPLPISYKERIAQVPGVLKVGQANWFGGLYQNDRAPFPQFAIDEKYLDVYPEYIIDPNQKEAFYNDRQGALIGEDIANKYALKIGDPFVLNGTIYIGQWDLTVRGIFKNRSANASSGLIFFQWQYLNERVIKDKIRSPNSVGIFVFEVDKTANASAVASKVDELFKNSPSETLTESETAFQQSFLSMASAIIVALNAISGIVIVIMLLVLANTMSMTVRERNREFSILKSIGFSKEKLALLIFGESILLSISGVILFGVILIPIFKLMGGFIQKNLSNFFPVFALSNEILFLAASFGVILGILSAIPPFLSVSRKSVVESLREL